MNASVHSGTSPLGEYAGSPPVLIMASSDEAKARATIAAEAAGLRAATVDIEQAIERLGIQGAARALWLEVDRDRGDLLDELLDRVELESRTSGVPTIVSAPNSLIDPVTARITDSSIELLIDATPADRAAALALASARHPAEARLHDISREPSAVRLHQLSDEVDSIAVTLDRLSVGPKAPAQKPEPPEGEVPNVSLDTVRQVIRARRLRARFFDGEMFADPAWDMLLDLLQAEIAQHHIPVSSLCIAASVPATTALRWIKTMTDAGLFSRRADPDDGRRMFVELAPSASEALRRYFDEVGKVAVI